MIFMENEKNIACINYSEDGSIQKLRASIYDPGDGAEYMFIEVIGEEIDIYDNEIVGEINDAKIDIKFGVDIEKAYMLRDFLNYALDDIKIKSAKIPLVLL